LSLEFHPLTGGCTKADRPSFGLGSCRRRIVLNVLEALMVKAVLGFALAGGRGQFNAAPHAAPIPLLVLAALLQIVGNRFAPATHRWRARMQRLSVGWPSESTRKAR
jgi:hypothetical protein